MPKKKAIKKSNVVRLKTKKRKYTKRDVKRWGLAAVKKAA